MKRNIQVKRISMKNIIKFKILIIDAHNIFVLYLENLNFFKIKINNSWCKCLVSGLIGELLNLSFLKIEKSVSKHGYHNKSIIKKGDRLLLELYRYIKYTENINPNK